MQLVKIDGVWINPKKVIMIQEAEVNPFDKDSKAIRVEITLEGYSPRPHPADYTSVIDEPNIIPSYLPLEEVIAIINGGLE